MADNVKICPALSTADTGVMVGILHQLNLMLHKMQQFHGTMNCGCTYPEQSLAKMKSPAVGSSLE